MDINNIIPKGHNNALTRSDLMLLTGLRDREIREAISNGDEVIINLCDGAGYFIPTKEERELVVNWVNMFDARIRAERARVERAKKWLAKNQ